MFCEIANEPVKMDENGNIVLESAETLTCGTPDQDVIGIIGAMDYEVDYLRGLLKDRVDTQVASMVFSAGRVGATRAVVVKSGVGKVNAALCATILVREFGATCVINTGAAGSLDAQMNIGDILVSTAAVQHDVDGTFFGYAKGEVPQLGMVSFTADEQLAQCVVSALQDEASDVAVFRGLVASGDQFIHTAEAKARILADFPDAVCCEMEGAAIAQTCAVLGVPFVIVRAISDKADATDYIDYNVFEEQAARHCAAMIEHVLRA